MIIYNIGIIVRYPVDKLNGGDVFLPRQIVLNSGAQLMFMYMEQTKSCVVVV